MDRNARRAADPNPVVVEVWRGDAVESTHRGAWVLADGSGRVLAGAGDVERAVYARSAIKALQALPLLETGAADRFAFGDADLAVAVASHNAEPCHTDAVAGILARLGLGVEHLRCGPQEPGDPTVRLELQRRGEAPTALHNNCSGKHAGFLAVALQLGVPVEDYLDPHSAGQLRVRAALGELCDLDPEGLPFAIDGCGAPTFRLPLRAMATAFARLTTPASLSDRSSAQRAVHCERLIEAVARHPVLIAGGYRRLCTALSRATGGRLFPKIGAEGVYAIGVRGADRGLAVKLDDGGQRGLHALVVGLVGALGLADPEELARLDGWTDTTLRNRSGVAVGRLEVALP